MIKLSRSALIVSLLVATSARAEDISLSADSNSTIHIIANSGRVSVTTGGPDVRITSSVGCRLLNPESALQDQGATLSLKLSFSDDCESAVVVPANKMIVIEARNHDAVVTGAAQSFLAEAANGSIYFSDTGRTPISAQASNGSIFVGRSAGTLGLVSINGNVTVSDSRGSFVIAGRNNSVLISNFIFEAGSTSTIKNINGQVLTKNLAVLTSSGNRAVLNVKAKAFSSIKFLGKRRFSSFPGRKWHSRSYGKGRSSAKLIVDAGSAFTMN